MNIYLLKKIILIAFISTVLIDCVNNASGFGKCKLRKPNVEQNFQPDRYLGKWFEQYRDKDTAFQKGDCVIAEYSKKSTYNSGNSLELKVNNSELNLKENKSRNERKVGEGRAYLKNTSVGKLQVSFAPKFLDVFDFVKGPYWVLDTDYENYAFVYSCKEYVFGLYHTEYFWILTREKTPSQETLNNYLNFVENKYGYNIDSFRRKTVQGDDVCFNYK